MEEKTMSINVQPISDENKKEIITAAVQLVNENKDNFGNDDRKQISKSSMRNLLNVTDGIPEEFTIFSYYLAGKNDRNKALIKFIEDINRDINSLTKKLKLEMSKSLVMREYMTAVVMASRYSEALKREIRL
jgi:hypothetical protein